MVSVPDPGQQQRINATLEAQRWAVEQVVGPALVTALMDERGGGGATQVQYNRAAIVDLACALVGPRWDAIYLTPGAALGAPIPRAQQRRLYTAIFELAHQIAAGRLGTVDSLADQHGLERP